MVWRENIPKKMLSDCHLWYLNLCNCLHDSHNEDGDEMYKFSPPLDVENILWFISIPRKWTDWVCKTDCTCKYHELVTYTEHFYLNDAERNRIIHCMAEDVLSHYEYEALCGHYSECLCAE